MMKRQKRDRLERAHAQGFKAGVSGRSKRSNVHTRVKIFAHSGWAGGAMLWKLVVVGYFVDPN